MGVIKKYSDIAKMINKNLDSICRIEKYNLKQNMADSYTKPIMRGEIEYVKELKELLKVKGVKNKDYIRVGGNGDGGYVMLDSFDRINCVYSIGVGAEIRFDEFFANRGLDVYMFDHTIDSIPSNDIHLHWNRVGICGSGTQKFDDLITLDDMVGDFSSVNGNVAILKMDVEGFEWDVLSTVKSESLDIFDQIVMEFHGLHDLNNRRKILIGLENLNKTHQLVHVHANNAGTVIEIDGWVLPDLLEVTYVNKNNYEIIPSDRCFPTALDSKNIELFPEITLGYWN